MEASTRARRTASWRLGSGAVALTWMLSSLCFTGACFNARAQTLGGVSPQEQEQLISRGRYLAIVGVCSACHTPPNVKPEPSKDPVDLTHDRLFRTDPDWFKYLDPQAKNYLSGGVPFILRLGPTSSGLVVTTNITPDPVDGIGTWTVQEIADAIRQGRRPKSAV